MVRTRGEASLRQYTESNDYHGDLIKGSEGEKRMKEYPMEDGSFMVFVKTDQGKICVKACRPCSCHSRYAFFETKGRLINHSSARANLKVQLQEQVHTVDKGKTEKRKTCFAVCKT